MTLDDAEKKYSQFERPVTRLEVNGAKLSGENLIYKDIRITLTAGLEASDCVLEILDASSRIDDGSLVYDKALDQLLLGAKLEVFLGYGKADNAESVFIGYISSLEHEFQGSGLTVYVTAMDCKLFMMSSFRSLRKKDIKKYSEAVSDVLTNYSAVYDGTVVEPTDEILAPIEQHNQSDYDFVASLARRLNYLFYVVAGQVHFVSYTKYTDSVLTVSPGRNLWKFNREISLSGQVKSITVRNHNPEDADQPFESKSDTITAIGGGEKSSAASSKLINDTLAHIVVDNSVRSEAEAKIRADALMQEMSMKFLSGSIEIPGIPAVIPGHMVTIEKLGDPFDRDYFIREVIHHADVEGYKTIIKIAGNMV